MTASITLQVLPQQFAVVRLGLGEGLPWWATTSTGLLVMVKTPEEVSIICEERLLPETTRAERGFRALRVAGTLDFQLTGVVASLTRPLAQGGIPVLVVSTFDTDYLLVRLAQLDAAVSALRSDGYPVEA